MAPDDGTALAPPASRAAPIRRRRRRVRCAHRIIRRMDRSPRENDDAHPPRDPDPDAPLSLWQIVASSLAAAFGVQSSRNRQRDFSRGRAIHFIIAGVVLTALFVLLMVMVVNVVLSGLR